MPAPLVLNPLLPLPAIYAAISVLLVLSLLVAWRTRLSSSIRSNLSSLLLRLVALGLLTLLLLRPQSVQAQRKELRAEVLLLVDQSQSLRISDRETAPSRLVQAQVSFEALLVGIQERNWPLELYELGDNLRKRSASEFRLRADGSRSPLGDQMVAALEISLQDRNIGAAMLISDGCVNEGQSLLSAAERFRLRNVPLVAIGLGEVTPPRLDVALLSASLRAESDEQTEIRAGLTMLVQGSAAFVGDAPAPTGPLADTIARLEVCRIDRNFPERLPTFETLTALRHRIGKADNPTPLHLGFTLENPGHYRLRLKLDPFSGERNLANNARYLSLRVLPRRQRGLYICSRLGQEYRNLRDLFMRWNGPEMNVCADFVRPVSNRTDTARWPVEHYLAGITSENRQRPLPSFIVWQDPDPTHLSADTTLRIRQALDAGKLGLLYLLTQPPSDLAKVRSGSKLEDTFLFNAIESAAVLPPAEVLDTQSAKVHVATQWAYGTTEHPWRAFGATLPLAGFRNLRSDAKVLLTIGATPLLTVGTVGQGRVAVLTTPESWRWLQPVAYDPDRSNAPQLAQRLWEELSHWLLGASTQIQQPLSIYLPRDLWALGQELLVRIAIEQVPKSEVLQLSYRILPIRAKIQEAPWISLIADDRRAQSNTSEALRVIETSIPAPGDAGEWLLQVRGQYMDGRTLGSDLAMFSVEGSSLEAADLQPALKALETAAAATWPAGLNGQRVLYRPVPEDLARLLDRLEPQMAPQYIEQFERRAIFSQTWAILLLVLSMSLDFWLRRGD